MTPSERSDPGIGNRASALTQPMFHRVLNAHPMIVRDTLQDVMALLREQKFGVPLQFNNFKD